MPYYVYEQSTYRTTELGIVNRKAAVPKGAVSTKASSLVAARELIQVRRARLIATGFGALSFSGIDVPFAEMWRR